MNISQHSLPASSSCVVIGLGYIGLPTSVTIARTGRLVVGVDINAERVGQVNRGECPIIEPHLPELLAAAVKSGHFSASTEPVAGDVFIIAVPTPFTGGFKPDISYVEAATRSIAPLLRRGNLVIVESTIPVGTTEMVARWIENQRPDLKCAQRNGNTEPDILVAHCPERVLPGQMVRELVENDRVIGGVCSHSSAACKAFYETFVNGKCMVTDSRTAELCKLTENSFRDVNIAFANELAHICDELDVSVWELRELANQHPRVNILKPGPGVGGHCIAVDPWFIVSAVGERAHLIREARWINSNRPRQVVQKVIAEATVCKARTVACLGLAYKANVEDMRESPAVEIVAALSREFHYLGGETRILVVEPHANELPEELHGLHGLERASIDDVSRADLLVLLVDHDEFKVLPNPKNNGKPFVDTRGFWT
jgi:UDP-N-acetyl-D-mannosaminuronic acid dehydrogenase